jgi:HlyD family secretion protein
MNRSRNLLILVAAIIVLVVVGVAASSGRKAPAISARLVTVRPTDFAVRLPETGTVQRPLIQTLPALVAGNVEHIYVKPGDHVNAGELLVSLSNPQLVDAAATAQQTYLSALGHSLSTQRSDTSNVVQMEANLESARFKLNQAVADQKAGTQTGLGYGFSSAQEARANADAGVATAETNLHEALRIYTADQNLYENKAISKDELDQASAKLEQMRVADEQAKEQRTSAYEQLDRQRSVLVDSVRAARDAVLQAQSQLAAAKANAANSPGDAEAARADQAARLEDAKYAREQVARLQIRAPFSGTVQTVANESTDALRTLQPGDAVTVGQALVSITTDANYIVRTKVDEQDVAQVALGQHATISGEDLGGKTLAAHVAAIGAVAQKSDDPSNTSHQVITTVALDQTLPFLRDGMSVDVDILTVHRHHVIAIPNDAIRHDDKNKPYVFVVGKGGHITRANVQLGTTSDAQSVVTSGLHIGDVIVSDTSPAIVANATVTAAPSPSPGPSSSP